MKKLLKVLLGIVILLAVVYAGIHIYFASGEAKDPPQQKAPEQAQASVNADSIQSDFEKHLKQNNGELFTAQIFRTIEDAKDSVKAGKTEAGIQYLQNAKDFISSHMADIEKMKGVDMGIIEWIISSPVEELLNSL